MTIGKKSMNAKKQKNNLQFFQKKIKLGIFKRKTDGLKAL